MLEQLPDLISPLATILAVILAYFFGRRQTEHERLYTRRAEVIAALFERFEDLDQRIASLVSPIEYEGGPDKADKAKLAGESFNDLQKYYRSNSIWLSRRTSKLFDDFLQRYKSTIGEFAVYVVRGRPISSQEHPTLPSTHDKWHELWMRFEKDSPFIRETLEEEFRAALGERRARIFLVWKSMRQLLGTIKYIPGHHKD